MNQLRYGKINEDVRSLEFLISEAHHGNLTDSEFGRWVRDRSQGLMAAIPLIRLFSVPPDCPAEMSKSDFGKLVAIVRDARKMGGLRHDEWLEELAANGETIWAISPETRWKRPVIDVLIAQAVVNFFRLLKSEEAAWDKADLKEIVDANDGRVLAQ